MKHLTPIAFALSVAVSPLAAQDTNPDIDQGTDLLEEGAKLLLRGLMTEMEPALKELEDAATELGPAMRMLADEMGPALSELMSQIDDIRHYQAPELLPNGDIIIRRRSDAPAYEVPEIEL